MSGVYREDRIMSSVGKMRHLKHIVCVLWMLFIVSTLSAAHTAFGDGLFRYSPFGHSLYADEHPNFVRMDVAYTKMYPVYDWEHSGKDYRTQTFGIFGFQLPLWYGQLADSTMALSVTAAMSANIWMDLFGGKTSPIVDTDYRIALPSVAFMHRINRGFARNYALSWSPFKHESTHIGDELQIQKVSSLTACECVVQLYRIHVHAQRGGKPLYRKPLLPCRIDASLELAQRLVQSG